MAESVYAIFFYVNIPIVKIKLSTAQVKNKILKKITNQ